MNELKWLLDERYIKHNESDIIGTLKSLKYDFEVKNYNYLRESVHKTYQFGDISTRFKDEDPMMMLGTIKFVSDHQKAPNPFGSLFFHNNVNMIDVMSNFNQLELDSMFLNGSAKITYIKEVCENIDFYIEKYDSFFIRPNSSLKSFTGTVITKSNYKDELDFIIKNQMVCKKTLCIVSKFEKIIDETRFVIVGNDVVASSKYIINGEIKSEQGSSEDSMLLAEKIANHKWHTKPDIAYILDIAETKDGAKAIELNCYSTSGFYLCKTDHIKMVNDAIIIELQESY